MLQLVNLILVLVTCFSHHSVNALDNGLALTPPMGWLAWERFVCETNCHEYPDTCISENLFKDVANRLITDGFAQAGYTYVNIDDCWSEKVRSNVTSTLVPDKKRFPSGISALADYIHSLGLKLGIYGDCGTKTCQLYPGQLAKTDSMEDNYFQIDADTFASWKIDSFKFDACNVDVLSSHKICPFMKDALNSTGRPILFSCSWPAYENDENFPTNFELVASHCNLWRAFGDIEDSWSSVLETIDWFVKKQDIIVKYHGPGQWFDADQLVIGDYGLSSNEEKAQMAIWSVWAVPLYMSNDLRAISKESSKLLRNKWLIQVNQDKHGVFGLMLASSGSIQVFVKPVEPIIDGCPSYVVVYLNRATLGDFKYAQFNIQKLILSLHSKLNTADRTRFFPWSECGTSLHLNATEFNVYDLLNENKKINRLTYESNLRLAVEPSSVRAIKLIQV